jgi:YYY domain-containing protein
MMLKLGMEMREQGDLAPFNWHEWLEHWLRFIVIVFFQICLIMVPMKLLGISMKLEVAIYLVILIFSMVINASQAGRSWNPNQFLQKVGWPLLAIITFSVLFFLPYILNYGTGYVSVELWKGTRTTLSEYLTVHGIFLFIAATFFVVVILTNYLKGNSLQRSEVELTGWAIYFVPILVIIDIVLIVLKLPIVALVVLFLSVGIWILLHRGTPIEVSWVIVLIIASLLLTLLVEVIVLKGDIGRSNTVFKFYLQAWVMFGVAGATSLGLMIEHLAFAHPLGKLSTSQKIRWAWWGAFSLLAIAGLLYPVVAAQAKMNDRYVEGSPSGLNGMNYMQGATYNENNQQLDLRWDYDAIQWMRANIKGSPVIMEGNTGLYRWGNRYSIYTGLPTVIGWDWHTKQQYSLLPGDLIDYRIGLVKEFYNTPDQARAMEIVRHYDISYVIIGGLERAIYDANGLNKFDQSNDLWKLVYHNEQVKIYEVH